MFKLISFQANGARCQAVNDKPAFFALTFNGYLVDYFGTIAAARLASERLQSVDTEATTDKCRLAA